MLYNLDWLAKGKQFPPKVEKERIDNYITNQQLFAIDHSSKKVWEHYKLQTDRITRIVGNFQDFVSFPIIFAYQRLLSLKVADLVCGEHPTIVGKENATTDYIKELREDTLFDDKLYSTILDLSRFGDAIWRVFKDEEDDQGRFTVWSPIEWYPIVMSDGTNRITCHVLAWVVNTGETWLGSPKYDLHVQKHYKGYYEAERWELSGGNGQYTIGRLLEGPTKVETGLDGFAVQNLRAFETSDTIYGFSDYDQIDSILSEIMVRIGQISAILDKHADPSITGPVSMLTTDVESGKTYLKLGKFFATSKGENEPKYMTWDGELDASFKQLEFLINQLYILSEMGSALLGANEKTGQAISGTAMRFKMVNPLVKARRITNALTLPVKKLIENLSSIGYETKLERKTLSITWKDGLPNDPKETAELAKSVTGQTNILPLSEILSTYYDKSEEEIKKIMETIVAEKEKLNPMPAEGDPNDPTKKLNDKKNKSDTGLNNFSGVNNK